MEIREQYVLLHTYQNFKRAADEVPFSCVFCDCPLAILDKPHGPVLWCSMDDSIQEVSDTLLEAIKEEMDGAQLRS